MSEEMSKAPEAIDWRERLARFVMAELRSQHRDSDRLNELEFILWHPAATTDRCPRCAELQAANRELQALEDEQSTAYAEARQELVEANAKAAQLLAIEEQLRSVVETLRSELAAEESINKGLSANLQEARDELERVKAEYADMEDACLKVITVPDKPLHSEEPAETATMECPRCGGTGERHGVSQGCVYCNGAGKVSADKPLHSDPLNGRAESPPPPPIERATEPEAPSLEARMDAARAEVQEFVSGGSWPDVAYSYGLANKYAISRDAARQIMEDVTREHSAKEARRSREGSEREARVVGMIKEGMRTAEIAEREGITVERVGQIRRKHDLDTPPRGRRRSELVAG